MATAVDSDAQRVHPGPSGRGGPCVRTARGACGRCTLKPRRGSGGLRDGGGERIHRGDHHGSLYPFRASAGPGDRSHPPRTRARLVPAFYSAPRIGDQEQGGCDILDSMARRHAQHFSSPAASGQGNRWGRPSRRRRGIVTACPNHDPCRCADHFHGAASRHERCVDFRRCRRNARRELRTRVLRDDAVQLVRLPCYVCGDHPDRTGRPRAESGDRSGPEGR